MNCFVFIFMITLAVATANPVDDLSYEETVNNCTSLKEENTGLRAKYNIFQEKLIKAEKDNNRHQKLKKKLKQQLRNAKKEAMTNTNAVEELESTRGLLIREQQDLYTAKRKIEEITHENNWMERDLEEMKNYLKSLNQEFQPGKTSPSYEIWLTENRGTAAEMRAECQRGGGDLVTWEVFGFGPAGVRYFSMIKSVLRKRPLAWIGMNDIATEGKYQWLDGSPYEPELDVPQYAKWHTFLYGYPMTKRATYPMNEIDDDHPQGSDCVVVTNSHTWVLLDKWCDDDYYGLCQRAFYRCY